MGMGWVERYEACRRWPCGLGVKGRPCLALPPHPSRGPSHMLLSLPPPRLSPPCTHRAVRQVYRLYSELISQAITAGGANAARTTFVKYMRSVKKVALKVRDWLGWGGARAARAAGWGLGGGYGEVAGAKAVRCGGHGVAERDWGWDWGCLWRLAWPGLHSRGQAAGPARRRTRGQGTCT